MAEFLADPAILVVLAFLGGVSALTALIRRLPWWWALGTFVGVGLFTIGLHWAGDISREAGYAVGLATLGVVLWREIDHRATKRGDRIRAGGTGAPPPPTTTRDLMRDAP